MAGHRERPERAEIPPVLESDQAEWNDNQEHSFLVNMPPEKECGVSTKRNGADEVVPVGTEPEFNQRQLYRVSGCKQSGQVCIPIGIQKSVGRYVLL